MGELMVLVHRAFTALFAYLMYGARKEDQCEPQEPYFFC